MGVLWCRRNFNEFLIRTDAVYLLKNKENTVITDFDDIDNDATYNLIQKA